MLSPDYKTKLALTSVLRICITLTRIKTGTLLDVNYAGSFSLQLRANGWPAPAKIRGFLIRCQLDSQLNKKGHSKQALFKTEGAPSTKLEIILLLPNSTMIKQNLSWNSNMSGKQGPSHETLSGGSKLVQVPFEAGHYQTTSTKAATGNLR